MLKGGEFMKKMDKNNIIRTSRKVASKAAKMLKDTKSPVAGSALVNRKQKV